MIIKTLKVTILSLTKWGFPTITKYITLLNMRILRETCISQINFVKYMFYFVLKQYSIK